MIAMAASIVVLSSFIPVMAQADDRIDSLELRYQQSNLSSEKILNGLNLIEYCMYADPPKGLELSSELLTLAAVKDNRPLYARLLRAKAVCYRNLSQTDSSTAIIERALKVSQALGDKNLSLDLYNDLSSTFSGIGAYNVSLNYLIKGLKETGEQDTLTLLPLIYNSMGNNYGLLKQYDASTSYYLKALSLPQTDSVMRATLQLNIGINYSETGRYDSAIYFIERSNTLNSVLKDELRLYNNYISYANTLALSGRTDAALNYIDQAIAFFEPSGNEWALGYCYDVKANTLRIQKKYEQARMYFQKAIAALKAYNDFWALKETYLNAHQLEKETGNSQKALDYYLQYTHLNDSISNAELKSEIYHLDKIYETEKKEARIKLLRQENEIKSAKIRRNTIILISFILLSLLLLSLAYVLKRSNDYKAETNLILQEKNEQLRTLNATKDKLFSIIAHDLKNPLSAFRNITGSLKNQFAHLSKEDIESFIGDLYDSSAKLMDLLQNLLKWAISQTNNIRVELQQQPLLPVVHRAIAAVQYNAEEKKIMIQTEVEDTMSVTIDANIVETILRNFLSNAVKFTPQGGSISVTCQQEGPKLKLAVSDSGIGIAPEDQKKLFSVNEDVSKIGSSPEKGTGLGLILCKELIEKMGGSIGVESQEQRGSTFYIVF